MLSIFFAIIDILDIRDIIKLEILDYREWEVKEWRERSFIP